MTVLDDVKKMQQQGKTDEEIIRALRDEGVSYKDISEALNQSEIKTAVEQPSENDEQYPQALPPEGQQTYGDPQGYEVQQPYDNTQYQDQQQPQYDYSQQNASMDTISEVAEQIIDEKMEKFRTQIEKMRSADKTAETKIEVIEERLKRIEKIIDNLQISVLRKVGDYLTNVDDIKKELIETQKSFSKVVPELAKAEAKAKKTTRKKTTRKKTPKKKK